MTVFRVQLPPNPDPSFLACFNLPRNLPEELTLNGNGHTLVLSTPLAADITASSDVGTSAINPVRTVASGGVIDIVASLDSTSTELAANNSGNSDSETLPVVDVAIVGPDIVQNGVGNSNIGNTIRVSGEATATHATPDTSNGVVIGNDQASAESSVNPSAHETAETGDEASVRQPPFASCSKAVSLATMKQTCTAYETRTGAICFIVILPHFSPHPYTFQSFVPRAQSTFLATLQATLLGCALQDSKANRTFIDLLTCLAAFNICYLLVNSILAGRATSLLAHAVQILERIHRDPDPLGNILELPGWQTISVLPFLRERASDPLLLPVPASPARGVQFVRARLHCAARGLATLTWVCCTGTITICIWLLVYLASNLSLGIRIGGSLGVIIALGLVVYWQWRATYIDGGLALGPSWFKLAYIASWLQFEESTGPDEYSVTILRDDMMWCACLKTDCHYCGREWVLEA